MVIMVIFGIQILLKKYLDWVNLVKTLKKEQKYKNVIIVTIISYKAVLTIIL